MAAVINTNISSLNAQRNLTTSQSSLATSLQRLSSGLRINSAKDDAAGLAISERFSTQIRGMNVAARNANDGISLAQSAEGAMTEIGNNLQRIRELAVQSRNATNSDSDRAALNAEANQLKAEIQRVAETTSFNGTKLLDGSFTAKSFQVGADQGQTIDIAQISDANTTKLGSWTSVATSASVAGAVAAGTTVPTDSTIDLSTATLNGSNGYDTFSLTVGGETLTIDPVAFDTDAATTQAALAAEIKAKIDANGTLAADLTVTVASGNLEIENGSTATSYAISGGGITGTAAAATSSFTALTGNAFTINGVNIEVSSATSAAQRSNQLVNAINAKTEDTGVTASLKDGAVVVQSNQADVVIGGAVAATVLAQTGLTTGTTAGGALTGSTAYVAGEAKTGFADLDISTAEGADNAILAMDAALTSINSARADMGAVQNRFTSVVASLQTTSENMSASRSRILDADFAAETANLTRGQILQQAGTAMLAQANSLPNGVLSLLRG